MVAIKRETTTIQAQHYVKSAFILRANAPNSDNEYLKIVSENCPVLTHDRLPKSIIKRGSNEKHCLPFSLRVPAKLQFALSLRVTEEKKKHREIGRISWCIVNFNFLCDKLP